MVSQNVRFLWATLYNTGLWRYYTTANLNKFRSCYHWCIKKFCGYDRMDSL